MEVLALALAFVLGAALATGVVFLRRKQSNPAATSQGASEQTSRQELTAAATAPEPEVAAISDRVVVTHGTSEAISLNLCEDLLNLQELPEVDLTPQQIKAAFSPALQALPSLATAQQMGSRNLMEVTIDGAMVRAADGDGFRAFAMDSNGIAAQGRLHEPYALQALALGAVVWHLTSVVVAQKHMADISRALERLRSGLSEVKNFLRQGRAARVEAGLNYVSAVLAAAEAGDFSPYHRQHLVVLARELDEVFIHVRDEIRSQIKVPIQRSKAGSGVEFRSLQEKISDLDRLVDQADLCLEVRAACWYATSLFPGKDHVLGQELDRLRDSSRVMARIRHEIGDVIARDIEKIEAFWNREETLVSRRDSIKRMSLELRRKVTDGRERRDALLQRVEAAVEEFRQPRRLYLEIEGSEIKSVREAPPYGRPGQ